MLGRMQPKDHALPDSRRLWRIDRAGSLARLALIEERLAPPADGEVHVEVRAIGLNFADIFACLGLYSATPQGAFVPGLECAGVVTAVGPGVTTWRIGDRVMVLTRFGGYATRLNARAETLWPIPAGWSFAQAAAYPVQALTAWYGLVPLGAARRDAVVLVQSAAGGVGLNALRALQALGARPVAVVGRAEKREFLMREFGLSPETVVLRDAALAKSLDAALAHLGAPGFDVVFDAVYGDAFRLAFDRLAPEGRYVLYGAAEFMGTGRRPNPLRLAWHYLRRPRPDPLAMISANRGLLAFNLIWLWGEVQRLPAAMHATLELIPDPPLIGLERAFDDAPAAMRALQSGATTGKVILHC
jgi:NADPH:quinone reductase-like Zn-dependent oxidoreductase